MSEYLKYRRSRIAELADWHEGFDMTDVSISAADKAAGSPKLGDKIARNPENHADRWLLAADYVALYFEAIPAAPSLTFDEFRAANVRRCLKWHPKGLQSWSPSDWLTAVTGELGELASLLKMRNRERDGLRGNKFSPTDKQIADELADVLTYLDLLAAALGVDLGRATVEKFNEVSKRVGLPDRL
ncbi:MAG: hypothetical protein ACREDH_12190 [Methylocella sp.]